MKHQYNEKGSGAGCQVFEKFKHPYKKWKVENITVFKKKRSLIYTAGAPLL
jgi:hypothetical protein